MVLRKVDSSAGAGLKGKGIVDVDEVLDVGGLAGVLPEFFLLLGIVTTPYRRAPPARMTSLITKPDLEVTPQPK